MKVVHLTSVHSAGDPRILLKQCHSLAAAGCEVVLIAPHTHEEELEGVRIRPVPLPVGRLARMLRTSWQLYKGAVSERAVLYHLHDPELIPIGALLKLRGAHVVYDVHEDYVTAMRQKRYLPRVVRWLVAELMRAVEWTANRMFSIVLAEKYYLRRFPRGRTVLNYPLLSSLPSRAPVWTNAHPVRLLYTGVVSEDRGAMNHAALVHLDDDLSVHLIGRCSPDLAACMRAVASPAAERLVIQGEGHHVPYSEILEAYGQGRWTAGLALFPPTPHYSKKLLTKFFEYMAAGIPIICSDFPAWRTLIRETGCGICVDPSDAQVVRSAIRWLVNNPEEGHAMGERGRTAVRDRYNWQGEAAKLVELYRSLLEGSEHRIPVHA